MLKTVLREVADFDCVLIDTSGVNITQHHAEISQYAPEALMHLVVTTEISRSSIEAIMKLSIDSKKPIGNGVITCLNMNQALKRITKGKEASRALISVLSQ